jgi:hypothetical protein
MKLSDSLDFRGCSHFIMQQSFGSKERLLRFPPCKRAFALKSLRADEW